MYFIIYEITNIRTGQIYIGQHTTNDLDDDYMGSGVRILNAYKKYGKNIFSKKILHIYDNFEEMDRKEAEIVNEDFIRRNDTYNVVTGGTGWCSAGTLVVENKIKPGVYFRIPKEDFNTEIYNTPTSNTVQVYLKLNNEKQRISVDEYHRNKYLYNTVSTGKLSVIEIGTGNTLSITIDSYNPSIHKKVFGGIVSEIDGKGWYVSKEEFYERGLVGIHAGKVTVLDNHDNLRKHVTKEEYQNNRERYSTSGAGTVVVKDLLTGIRSRVNKDIVYQDRDKWIIGTTGYTTVYDIQLEKFINIPKGTLDRSKHKLAQDRKIVCYKDGEVRFEFWGSKKEFLEKYKCPSSVWIAIIKQETFISDRKKSSDFNGCYFKLIDWKSPGNGS